MIAQAAVARARICPALHADTIVAHPKGIDGMKVYRDDVRARMVAHGRHPDDCKVLFMVAPIIGETEADAQERKRLREARAAAQIPQRLAFLGKLMNIDFGRLDLDKPIADELTTNGHQQTLDQFKKMAAGRTLREAMGEHNVTALSVEPDRHARFRRRSDGRSDGGSGRRRLPVLHAERQPPVAGGSRGWACPCAAGSRAGSLRLWPRAIQGEFFLAILEHDRAERNVPGA